MLQFLLWSNPGRDGNLNPQTVSKRLATIFQPLFRFSLAVETLSWHDLHLAYFAIPIEGWRPALRQEDEHTLVLALAYPLNGHAALASQSKNVAPQQALPRLARALQRQPQEILERLHPPLLLFWIDRQNDEAYLVSDGLGHAQLFEYARYGRYAYSNRLFAFRALQWPLEPQLADWAANTALGYFPMQTSGFKAIRFAAPSTLYRWTPHEATQQRLDILSCWVHPGARREHESLEMARQAIIGYLRATRDLYCDASGGLTGGFDSRAIFATCRYLGFDLRARVKGPENNYDVRLARRLAKVAGMDLNIKGKAEQPAPSPDQIRRSVRAALLWQAANMVNQKLVSFLPQGDGLPSGSVNVMGHDGFIGRGFFEGAIKAWEIPPSRYEDRIVAWYRRRFPYGLRQVHSDAIDALIRQIFRQALNYGLEGKQQLDFLYLFERTRRWSSGAQHSQTSIVLAPFLNADFIRAVYSYRGSRMRDHVFHRHIIARHAPDWSEIPFERELKQADRRRRAVEGSKTKSPTDWRRSNNTGYFNRMLFWRQVGAPLLQECLDQGQLWRQIYDPDRIRSLDQALPLGDELVTFYELERLCAD
jgi:hypothetical protein